MYLILISPRRLPCRSSPHHRTPRTTVPSWRRRDAAPGHLRMPQSPAPYSNPHSLPSSCGSVVIGHCVPMPYAVIRLVHHGSNPLALQPNARGFQSTIQTRAPARSSLIAHHTRVRFGVQPARGKRRSRAVLMSFSRVEARSRLGVYTYARQRLPQCLPTIAIQYRIPSTVHACIQVLRECACRQGCKGPSWSRES